MGGGGGGGRGGAGGGGSWRGYCSKGKHRSVSVCFYCHSVFLILHYTHVRSSSPQLLSEDMRRERERQTWEKQVEQELELDKPVGPTHYQSIQEGEVRSHGVGYYRFSEEEEQRKKQMNMLDKLRKEVSSH